MKREATLSNLLNQTFAEIGEHRNLVGIFLAFMIPVNALSAWFEEADSSTFGFNFGFQITQSTLEQGIVAVIVVLAAFVVIPLSLAGFRMLLSAARLWLAVRRPLCDDHG